MGFYTTRYFEANTLEQAEEKASENIREDKKLNASVLSAGGRNVEIFSNKFSLIGLS